jgi:hypothetical protein
MLKGLFAGFLTLALASPAQRIENEPADRSAVKTLETAVDHLTVIEFAEPVTMAAAGSPAFRIERQGNKVFVQPLEDGVSTNLFVWTASTRFTYELQPAVSVETAHFAIDQQVPVREPDFRVAAVPSPGELAGEIVLDGIPVWAAELELSESEVTIRVTDVLQRGPELLLRYTIDNRSREPYLPGLPAVVSLTEPRSPVSLFIWRYSQVGREISGAIRSSSSRRPVQVSEAGPALSALDPGARRSGLLTLDFAIDDAWPSVLELTFPSNGTDPIAITLIL